MQKILKTLRTEGLHGLFSRLYFRLKFKRAGVDFSMEEFPNEDRIPSHAGEARAMVSSSVHLLFKVLSKIAQADKTMTDGTFVDLGCGKGQPIYAAHRYGFRCVIGVEFVSRFCEIARQNMKRLNATDVIIHHNDAAQFDFPPDLKVLFLFNPFGEDVMSKVCENLKRRVQGRYHIVYDFPSCRQVIEDHLSPKLVFGKPGENVLIYEVNGRH